MAALVLGVQNGIALYATWTTIATLLNFTVVLIYNGNVSDGSATVSSLCILFFELILWFYLENFLLEKYLRYTLTIYPVVILALSGTLHKSNITVSPNPSSIITDRLDMHMVGMS
ncbi:Protein Ycf2 [Varanus komodoensis]|nr:Protein Ycf2 [Varanus komodoensis]